jgi:DNA-binding beta-propeller fold protein YncE
VVLAATTATTIDATVASGSPPTSEPVLTDADDGRPAGSVWVVNREAGEVAIFDARTGDVLARQSTGAGAHDVAISDAAGSAFITNENEDTISIVSTGQLDATTVDLGPKPHHVEVSRDGDTIAVGLVGTNAVALIDTATGQTENITSSANPAAAAHGPYLLDGTLYVAHETGDEVTAIETTTGEIVFSVGGISQPTEVLPDSKAELLYVSARGEDAIKVVDLRTQSIVGEVEVGDQPETLLLTGDERTLIVTMRGTPARLAFIDTGTLAVTELVDLAGPDTSGDLAAISDDDGFVYATFDRGETGTGGVAVVDVERRAVIDTWDYPDVGRVHGIAYTNQTPQSP